MTVEKPIRKAVKSVWGKLFFAMWAVWLVLHALAAFCNVGGMSVAYIFRYVATDALILASVLYAVKENMPYALIFAEVSLLLGAVGLITGDMHVVANIVAPLSLTAFLFTRERLGTSRVWPFVAIAAGIAVVAEGVWNFVENGVLIASVYAVPMALGYVFALMLLWTLAPEPGAERFEQSAEMHVNVDE